jgi:hypothetical protein
MHRRGAEDVEGSDIPLAKAQRFKFEFRNSNFEIFLGNLGAFARNMVFPISSSFPNFK